jgi:hypothetical protein
MHWRRAHRVADGVDGKTGADADAFCGPHRHNRPSCRLQSSVSSQYLEFICVQMREVGDPAHLPTQRPTVALWAGCDGSGHWIRHAKSAVEHRDA